MSAVDTSGNESGFSSPAVSKTIPAGTTVPPAPALTSPASGGNAAGTSVTFSWQAAQGATDYNLKVFSSTGAVTFDQWLGNVTSRTVTGFANQGQSQSWSVTARNAAGTGPASAQWSFTNGTATPSVPPAPVLVSPANGSTVPGTSITFQWNASPGATQYVFRQWRQNGTLNVERQVGNVTSYTMSGFSNSGYTNSWSVTALNAAGQGTSSEKWTFKNGPVTGGVPPAPALTSPASGGNVAGTSVTFSWQAAQGATDYNLKVFSSTGAVTFDQWLGNVTSRTVTGFANQGQSQSWSVTARNAAGTGPASAQRSFTNGTATPPSTFLLSPANGANAPGGSITFKWNKAPNATYYRLQVYRSNGSLFSDRWVGGNLSYTVSGFPNNGEKFSWQVYPYGSSGQLTGSPKWTFVNK